MLRTRWLDARREEALVRWSKRAMLLVVLAAAVWLALNWWIVRAYLTGREEALAAACSQGPFAAGVVTSAGGPEAVLTPDSEVLAPYREDPETRTVAAREVRDHASLLDEPDLAAAATTVMLQGPFDARAEIAEVEAGCRRYIDAHG